MTEDIIMKKMKTNNDNSIWNRIKQRVEKNKFIKEDDINIIIKEEIQKNKDEYNKTYHSEWYIF